MSISRLSLKLRCKERLTSRSKADGPKINSSLNFSKFTGGNPENANPPRYWDGRKNRIQPR